MRNRKARLAAASLVLTAAAMAAGGALASPASAAPSKVTQGASASNSVAKKSATAVCPRGTRVYGGGGDVVNGGNQVALTGLRPASVLVSGVYTDSYTAIAEEDDTGYTANWSVYSYAICGPALPKQSIQRSVLASTASDRIEGGVTCPSGTAPLGLGAEIGNGYGNVVLTNVTGNYVLNAFGVPYGWGGAKAFEDETGYSGSWTLTTYAVCAAPPPGLTYVFGDSAVNSADKPNTAAECPAGTKVYGAGGYENYYTGQTHFDRMVPHGTYWTGADVDTREDQTGFTPNWSVAAEAICAR